MIVAGLLFLAFIAFATLRHHHPREISLFQAIDMSFPQARQWSRDAKLVYAVSTDSGKAEDGESRGRDGRWPDWNVVFVDQKTGVNLLVALRGGREAYTRELLMAYKSPINPNRLRYDSTSALAFLQEVQGTSAIRKAHFELLQQGTPVLRIYLDCILSGFQVTSIDEASGKIISKRQGAVD